MPSVPYVIIVGIPLATDFHISAEDRKLKAKKLNCNRWLRTMAASNKRRPAICWHIYRTRLSAVLSTQIWSADWNSNLAYRFRCLYQFCHYERRLSKVETSFKVTTLMHLILSEMYY